jgi:hypothetical protein
MEKFEWRVILFIDFFAFSPSILADMWNQKPQFKENNIMFQIIKRYWYHSWRFIYSWIKWNRSILIKNYSKLVRFNIISSEIFLMPQVNGIRTSKAKESVLISVFLKITKKCSCLTGFPHRSRKMLWLGEKVDHVSSLILDQIAPQDNID